MAADYRNEEEKIWFAEAQPEYEIDFDKIQTVEDVKNILKSVGVMVWSVDEYNKPYLKKVRESDLDE